MVKRLFSIYRSRPLATRTGQWLLSAFDERHATGSRFSGDECLYLLYDMAITRYADWVSPEGRGFVKVDNTLTPDPVKGKEIFAKTCSTCHGDNGGGQYNDDGAGMARTYKAAAFVKGKIPFGQGNTLTDQEAIDVASYFTHLPRPVKANKDKDWPKGGAPVDVRR